jgi:multicomponent Na+:H+ antiporter subunit D
VLVGLGLGFTPGLAGRATQWAQRLEDRPGHAAEVLHEAVPPAVGRPGFHPGTAPYVYGGISTAGALGFALFGLYRRRLPALGRSAGWLVSGPAARLKALHSGVVGDYVAWLTFGAAALTGLLALTVR